MDFVGKPLLTFSTNLTASEKCFGFVYEKYRKNSVSLQTVRPSYQPNM